ncbi:hypothetical protein ACM70Y_12555, partial [Pseudomonas aeruginosa]
SGKRQRLDSSAAFFYLQAGSDRRQQKTGAKAGFSAVLCSPWKRLGSQDGAREGTELMAEDADSLELCFLALFLMPPIMPQKKLHSDFSPARPF